MPKFTKPQRKLLVDLVEGCLVGREYVPGDGRVGVALLRTGLVEFGYNNGCVSIYKLTELGREKFKIDKLREQLDLTFLINDPIYLKCIEFENKSDQLQAEAARLEEEQYDLSYDAYCMDGLIYDIVRENRYSIQSIVEKSLLED